MLVQCGVLSMNALGQAGRRWLLCEFSRYHYSPTPSLSPLPCALLQCAPAPAGRLRRPSPAAGIAHTKICSMCHLPQPPRLSPLSGGCMQWEGAGSVRHSELWDAGGSKAPDGTTVGAFARRTWCGWCRCMGMTVPKDGECRMPPTQSSTLPQTTASPPPPPACHAPLPCAPPPTSSSSSSHAMPAS